MILHIDGGSDVGVVERASRPHAEEILSVPFESGAAGAGRRAAKAWEQAAVMVASVASPRGAWVKVPVATRGKNAFIDGQQVGGVRIPRVLAHCESAFVVAATVGEEVEVLLKHHQAQRRMPVSYLVDRAASVAAELFVNSLHEALAQSLPPHLGVTRRYSPGYCDWPLEQQRVLFDVLPERPAGIQLLEGCLMTPRKSISGIIGIGVRDEVRRYGNACAFCPNSTCTHRREND